MAKVQFRGSVLPNDPIRISIKVVPINWKSPDIGLDATFSVNITDSVVTVDCETNEVGLKNFSYLYFRAIDLARAPVDLIAFSKGVGLTVILDKFVNEAGAESPIVPKDTDLSAVCTAFDISPERGDDLDKILQHVISTPEIFMALNDLISGIIYPHYGPRVAAQAVETIRIALAPVDASIKQSWKNLQDTLRISEDYLKFISVHGTGPRHGDRTHIPSAIIKEQALRAWTVMNRYLEYRKQGNQLLPESAFPIL